MKAEIFPTVNRVPLHNVSQLFVIILPSSCYDLLNVEKDVKSRYKLDIYCSQMHCTPLAEKDNEDGLSLFLNKKIRCDPTLQLLRWYGSNEGSLHMFWWKNIERNSLELSLWPLLVKNATVSLKLRSVIKIQRILKWFYKLNVFCEIELMII